MFTFIAINSGNNFVGLTKEKFMLKKMSMLENNDGHY
jgi:hypothetical protein